VFSEKQRAVLSNKTIWCSLKPKNFYKKPVSPKIKVVKKNDLKGKVRDSRKNEKQRIGEHFVNLNKFWLYKTLLLLLTKVKEKIDE
jgi:hypothetical protein